MAFKMKGPSMHKGTLGHKNAEAAQRNFNEMKVNRDLDNTSVADGRAGSSAFQYKEASPTKAATDKDKITWDKERKVSETKTKNAKGGEDTKTDYETTGTSKGAKVEKKATTPEEIAAYKKYTDGVKSGKIKRNTKYDDKTHTKGRSETSSTRKKMETTPKVTPKKVEVKTNNDIKPKETREQKRTRLKKEREDKRSYTVSSEKSTFKRKVIKDKETGEERKVGRSKFGKLVSKVTGRDTQKTGRVKRRKLGKGKKRGGTSCSF